MNQQSTIQNPRAAHGGSVFPEHCCAIIACDSERLLLELRPAKATYAPDKLACFGGKREPGEDAEQCLRRELREELAWEPVVFEAHVDLWRGERYIARFSTCVLPPTAEVRPYTGACAVRVPVRCLAALPLTPWHAAVLAAWLDGRQQVDLDRIVLPTGQSTRNPAPP
jgi:8-oxo-dGTP pyrophosphatase MutT (NUDIX family)